MALSEPGACLETSSAVSNPPSFSDRADSAAAESSDGRCLEFSGAIPQTALRAKRMLQGPAATPTRCRYLGSSPGPVAESSALSSGVQDSPDCSKAHADRLETCLPLASPERENTAKETAGAKMRRHAASRKSSFAFRRSGEDESERREKVYSRPGSNVPGSGKVWSLSAHPRMCEKSLAPLRIRAVGQVISQSVFWTQLTQRDPAGSSPRKVPLRFLCDQKSQDLSN